MTEKRKKGSCGGTILPLFAVDGLGLFVSVAVISSAGTYGRTRMRGKHCLMLDHAAKGVLTVISAEYASRRALAGLSAMTNFVTPTQMKEMWMRTTLLRMKTSCR